MSDPPGSRWRVEISGRLPPGVAAADLRRAIASAGRVLGLAPSALNLRFAGDRAVRGYNRRFRGVDAPTDVLSFPAAAQPRGGGVFLGDLLISRDRARVQARRSGLELGREVEELVLHGLLHLLGYDHDRDRGEMNRLEWKLRARVLDRAAPAAAGR